MKKYIIFIILVSFIIIGHNINVLSTEVKTGNNQYEMVIVSPKIFSNQLEPLVIHKNNNGINTMIKNIEDIYEEFIGKDPMTADCG